MNVFEKELGIAQPSCCSLGDCCKGASPSTPFYELWEKARDGDEFARGFFSIMQPYESFEAAEKVVPGLVERTLNAARRSKEFKDPENDLIFYHCRYLLPNNRCGVHEDRPQFCRDYPDTPYVVMAPGCAFEGWAAQCKSKVSEMKAEIDQIKELKKELAELRGEDEPDQNSDDDDLLNRIK